MTDLSTFKFAAPRRRALAPRLVQAWRIQRERRALRRLSPEQLSDIGITRDQAQYEANRKAWDAPDCWRQP